MTAHGEAVFSFSISACLLRADELGKDESMPPPGSGKPLASRCMLGNVSRSFRFVVAVAKSAQVPVEKPHLGTELCRVEKSTN